LAALSLLGIVMTSERGSARLGAILGGTTPSPPVQTAALTPPQPLPDPAVAQLTEQVHTLAAQRDRLAQRVATLEQTLADVTASIRQPPMQPPAPMAQTAPPPVVHQPTTTTPAQSAVGPAPSSVATLNPKPAPVTAPPPLPDTAGQSPPVANPPAAAEQSVPLPPTRTAAAPADENAAPPPPVQDTKAEHGIDLGGAPTQAKLSAHWIAVKAAYGPLIADVKPMVRMRERRPGDIEFRLILGPLPTASAAAALCAHLSAVRPTYCRATQYSPVRAATR
jgi:hypothetical protein